MPDRLTGSSLAIATGHDLSMALFDQTAVMAERQIALQRGHSERLMPELRLMLAPLGGAAIRPDRIVVEIGPGSFTGLRIGIAAARALGLAWRCPVFGVRSTLLVAAQALEEGQRGPLLVALAAPRGQVWLEAFHLPALASLGLPVARFPSDAEKMARDYTAVAGNASGTVDAGQPFSAIAVMAASARFLPMSLLQEPAPLYTSPDEARVAA